MYGQEYDRTVSTLRLLRVGDTIEEIAKVPIIGSKKIQIEFSADGRLLVVLLKKINKLIIYRN